MRVRTLRLTIGLAGAALLAAGVLAVVAAVMTPVPDLAAAAPVVAEAGVGAADAEVVPPLETFGAAWETDLRRPLTDSPATGAAGAGANGGPPSVRLVGTIVDGTRPRGVFAVGLAGIELRGVGEKAGGAEVVHVDERSATLSYAGREVTLKLEKLDPLGVPDPPAGAAAPADGATAATAAGR